MEPNYKTIIWETIIWNKGDKPEKSAKRKLVDVEPNSDCNFSLSINSPLTTYRQANNKRQDSSDKISERYLIEQRGLNPYITHSSYENDIVTQQSFLIPKSSNENPKSRIEFT